MPLPPGVNPKPTPIYQSSGIPSSPMDRTRTTPETLDQLARRSGKK
jgi:hypothetical protein